MKHWLHFDDFHDAPYYFPPKEPFGARPRGTSHSSGGAGESSPPARRAPSEKPKPHRDDDRRCSVCLRRSPVDPCESCLNYEMEED